MKKLLLLTKTLLAAVLLMGGANSAWGNYRSNTVGTKTTLTWDFGEFGSSESSYVSPYDYNGLSCVMTYNSSKDYITSSGFHANGTSSSSNRYMKLTPSFDGTIQVFYKSNNSSATDRIVAVSTTVTTGTSLTIGTGGVVGFGITDGYTEKKFSANLTAGSSYYIYNANGGCTITKIVYTYRNPWTEVYERGYSTAWSDDDVATWTGTTGDDYSVTKTASGMQFAVVEHVDAGRYEYEYNKSITTTNDYAVNIQAVWSAGSPTGKVNKNYSYIDFGGVKLRLYGQNSKLTIQLGSGTEKDLMVGSADDNSSTLRNQDFNIDITIHKATGAVEYSVSTSAWSSGTPVTGNGTLTTPVNVNAFKIGYARNGQQIKSFSQTLKSIKIKEENEIESAIADCKKYETSSEFATAIDAESFSTVAQVYAFHSAWQIAKAKASGSTDYSKAIMNKTFELHNTNGWTIYGDPATGGADSDNNGIVEYGEGWSQYYTGWNGRNVSQNISTLPAGTYRLTAKVYSGGGGAPVRLFANGQLADAENGDDHDPVLNFTVTGNESSIKIGIGGTGHEDDTDNTWGNWWYRVKNFTLTKTGDIVKLNAAGYATYSANYDVEVSGAKAYTAVLDFAKSKITCSEITSNKVPAGNGVLLYGDANADVTLSITADAAALGANSLKATTNADGSLATKGSNDYYALDGDTFKQYIGDAFVHNKAYFEVEGGAVLARSMRISFGDITGVDNVEAASEAKAKEGKFIENGKLVIVKNGVKYNAAGAKLY